MRSLAPGTILLALALLMVSAAEAATPKYDTAEIVVHSSLGYDAAGGQVNPFTDIDLTFRVTSPSGKVYTVDGFFDGDGLGGNFGDVFKGRVFTDETGTWRWTSTSGEPSLDGESGSIECSGTLPGAFGKGPIVASSRYFKFAKGSSVFLMGKYLDEMAVGKFQKSQAMFSETWTDADRQTLLDRHAALKLNKMAVYVANRGDLKGTWPTTPWLGTADANVKHRFDLKRWQTYETWTRKLREKGFAAQLWFFADESGYGDLPDADRKLLLRYGMARLSGYANTLFILASEWEEGWTRDEVNLYAGYLQAHNPWKRLVTTHAHRGTFDFPTESWATYMAIQSGNLETYAYTHDIGLKTRAQAAKPVLNEEFCGGYDKTQNRMKLWAAFTAGPAGTGTGGFVEHLATFVKLVPFQKMSPHDELIVGGSGYVLAEMGKNYVVYLYDGVPTSVDLTHASGWFDASWYDPRTGQWEEEPDVSGGGIRTFTPPTYEDWVLRLKLR